MGSGAPAETFVGVHGGTDQSVDLRENTAAKKRTPKSTESA